MKTYLLPLSIAAALLTGCGSDSDSSSTGDGNSTELTRGCNTDTTTKMLSTRTLVSGIDAKSEFAYYDLDSGQELDITDEQAATNTEWDIAFYGTSVILNGGYSGPGDVKAYYTGNNADFRDEEGNAIAAKFMAATAESELQDYTDVTATDIPESSDFVTDEFTTIFQGFYNYDFQTHVVTANAEQDYLIETSCGYSQVHVTDLTTEGRYISTITLGNQYKHNDDQMFSVENIIEVDMTACTDDVYVDLDMDELVEADANWELKFTCVASQGADFEVLLGDSTIGLARDEESDWEKALEYMGTDYINYYLKADGAETVFKNKHKWYEYDLDQQNQIWSQYGVYIIDTGTNKYKFQITSYYGLDGETVLSRNYSFRYEALLVE